MRKEFKMTGADMDALMNASKPVPCMMIGGYSPATPQENANNAWASLGRRMGFDHMTVQPVPGKGTHYFTAEVAAVTEATPVEPVPSGVTVPEV